LSRQVQTLLLNKKWFIKTCVNRRSYSLLILKTRYNRLLCFRLNELRLNQWRLSLTTYIIVLCNYPHKILSHKKQVKLKVNQTLLLTLSKYLKSYLFIRLNQISKNRQVKESDNELRSKQTLSLCWMPLLLIVEKLLQYVADEVNI